MPSYPHYSPRDVHFAIVDGYDWYTLPPEPGYYWVLKPDISGGWEKKVMKVYEYDVGTTKEWMKLRVNYGGPASDKRVESDARREWLYHGPIYEPSNPHINKLEKFREE